MSCHPDGPNANIPHPPPFNKSGTAVRDPDSIITLRLADDLPSFPHCVRAASQSKARQGDLESERAIGTTPKLPSFPVHLHTLFTAAPTFCLLVPYKYVDIHSTRRSIAIPRGGKERPRDTP